MDLLARMSLTDALTAGVAPVRQAMTEALRDDERLAGIGVSVASARVVAIRPEPELERAFADGVESDHLPLTWGQAVHIDLADRHLLLVTGPAPAPRNRRTRPVPSGSYK